MIAVETPKRVARRRRFWRTAVPLVATAVSYWAFLGLFEGPGSVTAAVLATAAVAIWYWADPGPKVARTAALALAVWSHGPQTGKAADRCYPARADHFLRWIRTGDNPKDEDSP